ncbi:MAG: 3-hydroxy-3-methylglutaryl-CoA reductase, partial [Anaerolineae bacterium]|nr:3-hydroxy-3-methylglutaryl-CoA reductase [Anaerolineae bacterium]
MTDHTHTSRLPGFYKRPLAERAAIVAQWANLTPDEQAVLIGVRGLNAAAADNMIENAVGVYALPLGIATNFLINGVDVLVPMVVEEPSVVAAVSNAARLFREGGGFTTASDEPIMIGQIQVMDVEDLFVAAGAIKANRARLLALADEVGGSIVRRGGGARDIEVRLLPETGAGPML